MKKCVKQRRPRRQQEKKKLLYVVSFVTFSFLLVACLPKKPNVELCQFDFERTVAICGMTEEPDGEIYEKELVEMDGATMFTPEAWEDLSNYVDRLEVEISQRK